MKKSNSSSSLSSSLFKYRVRRDFITLVLLLLLLAALAAINVYYNLEKTPLFLKQLSRHPAVAKIRSSTAKFFKKVSISSSWNKKRKRKKPPEYVKSVEFKCSSVNDPNGPHKNIVPNINFTLYVIAHDDFSFGVAQKWSRCMPFVKIFKIPSTHFFESFAYRTVLSDMGEQASWDSLDLVGLATYKSLKFVSVEKLVAYIELAYYKPYDLVPLYTTGENLVPQALRGHTEQFGHVWTATLQALGFNKSDIRDHGDNIEVFLRNTFITRPNWMKRLASFMNRSLHVAESNETLNAILNTDSHYREAKLNVARTVFNADYYHWHPFIFERLPAFFMHYHNVTTFGSLYQTQWFENTQLHGLYSGLR